MRWANFLLSTFEHFWVVCSNISPPPHTTTARVSRYAIRETSWQWNYLKMQSEIGDSGWNFFKQLMCIEMKFEAEVRFKNKTNTALCRTSFCQISSCSESDTFKVGSWIHPDPNDFSGYIKINESGSWIRHTSRLWKFNVRKRKKPSTILCFHNHQPSSAFTTLNHPLQPPSSTSLYNHNPQSSSAKPQPSTILCKTTTLNHPLSGFTNLVFLGLRSCSYTEIYIYLEMLLWRGNRKITKISSWQIIYTIYIYIACLFSIIKKILRIWILFAMN